MADVLGAVYFNSVGFEQSVLHAESVFIHCHGGRGVEVQYACALNNELSVWVAVCLGAELCASTQGQQSVFIACYAAGFIIFASAYGFQQVSAEADAKAFPAIPENIFAVFGESLGQKLYTAYLSAISIKKVFMLSFGVCFAAKPTPGDITGCDVENGTGAVKAPVQA